MSEMEQAGVRYATVLSTMKKQRERAEASEIEAEIRAAIAENRVKDVEAKLLEERESAARVHAGLVETIADLRKKLEVAPTADGIRTEDPPRGGTTHADFQGPDV